MSLEDLVLDALTVRSVPLLVGDPGVGKTAFSRRLARQIGGRSFFVCLSHTPGHEIHGLPVIAKQTMSLGSRQVTIVEQAPPAYAVQALQDDKPILIVYDDLTCLPPTESAPTLEVLAESQLAGFDLDPERIALMACANPAETAAGGYSLALPVIGRLTRFDYKLDPVDWAQQFPSYWGEPPVLRRWGYTLPEHIWQQQRAAVAAYIQQSPDALMADLAKERPAPDTPFPSPRSWDKVSRTLTRCEDRGRSFPHIQLAVAGDIGAGAASKFCAWYARFKEKPLDLFKLVMAPATYKPKLLEVYHRYYVLMGAAAIVTSAAAKDQEDLAKLWDGTWKLIDATFDVGDGDTAALAARKLVPVRSQHPRLPWPKAVHKLRDLLHKAGVNWAS